MAGTRCRRRVALPLFPFSEGHHARSPGASSVVSRVSGRAHADVVVEERRRGG
jgi:hypothetical protein